MQEPDGGMLGPPGQRERETSSAFPQLYPRRADRPLTTPHRPLLPTDLPTRGLLSLGFLFCVEVKLRASQGCSEGARVRETTRFVSCGVPV